MARNYGFENFPTGNPPAAYKWEDFVTDEALTEFVATAIASGTNVVGDTDVGGVARLSGAATTDDSGCELQRDAAWLALPLGKTLRFETRIRFGETTSVLMPTQSDFFAGIGTLDASIIASAPTNGIYFRKDDGDDLLDLVVRVAGADSVSSLGAFTVAKDVWYRLGFMVTVDSVTSGKGTVTFYVDGTSYGSFTLATGLPLVASMMSEFVAFQTGDALGTKYVDIDYIGAEITR